MAQVTAREWLCEAAHQVEEKEDLYVQVACNPDMPPEAIECAKNLVLLTKMLLMRCVAKYLKTL
jgi:hypothetical protein